ncbi:sigma-Y antisigma factor component [Neobacillus sp. MM2021_6]|uniref:sigma-Y antisigma factor component n=1 Tax=Bacillaceae TaxID=186817 RepID=UPI00140A95D9|nr:MULTISPECIES: sigma-Y antisigma factor component [Bacillaceae]MBO0961307.1 sigma-Y antisigma factor component [Neobacillus sp. MM2021_6]NHC18801.1 sigma-Y antisigma factor component [Bacillus sp. MM2020_4]
MNKDLSLITVIGVVLILTTQSIYLFIDARKRNHNYWLWGIVGLIQAPMPTLFYLIFVRKIFRKNDRKMGDSNDNDGYK